MPGKNNSYECIGEYFLLNSEPKPIQEFNHKFLSQGKSIYEVYRIYNGIPLFFKEHFQRLSDSTKASKIALSISRDDLKNETKKLIEINNILDANIKLVLNKNKESENIILYFDNSKYPTEEDYRNGIKLGLFDAERKYPNIKYINHKLRTNTTTKMSIKGYFELLLVKDRNHITEGSRSNVFFIKGDKIFTPPLQYVLPGITRDKVIEACQSLGLEIIQKIINVSDLIYFESGFITGTSPKVLPIKSIDNITYNINSNIIKAIANRYDEMIITDLGQMEKEWY